MSSLDLEPPYDQVFKGVLCFTRFRDAENCLGRLEALRRGFVSEGDLLGLKYCRELAKLGRRRAELISRNKRVGPPIRQQKREIASWFRTWLEAPEIFKDWLMLRKQTAAFQELQEIESGAPYPEERRPHAGKC